MRSGTELINYIDTLRVKNGMSWNELTAKSGVSTSALHMCEKRNQYPGVKTLYEISKIFNISFNEMLGLESKKENEIPPNIQGIVNMLLAISEDRIEEIENSVRFIYEKEIRKKSASTEVG